MSSPLDFRKKRIYIFSKIVINTYKFLKNLTFNLYNKYMHFKIKTDPSPFILVILEMTNECILVGTHLLRSKQTELSLETVRTESPGAPVGEDISLTKPPVHSDFGSSSHRYTNYESYRQDKPLVCTLLKSKTPAHKVIHPTMYTGYNEEDSLVFNNTACSYGVFKTKSATYKKDKDV
jgi:hypothetical protein